MKFDPYRNVRAYHRKLEETVRLLDVGVEDPRQGVELVAAFYRADDAILGACDDSSGMIGDVFRFDVLDRFVAFAVSCDDRPWIADLVFDLLQDDGFGIRDTILDRAAEFLPEENLRTLADRFWEAAGPAVSQVQERHERDRRRHHWLNLVTQVAQQLKDPDLYERAERALSPDLGVAARVEIARVHLSANQPEAALEWLEGIGPRETYMSVDRDRLLKEIYRKLGRLDDLQRLVTRRFRADRNRYTFAELLDVVGQERRDALIAESVEDILHNDSFSASEAQFLVDCDRTSEAATYPVRLRDTLGDTFWAHLHSLAEHLRDSGHALAATVLYRSLLSNILEFGTVRAYGHGARHLRELERLAQQIDDWDGLPTPAEYAATLRERHRRKASFWSRVDT